MGLADALGALAVVAHEGGVLALFVDAHAGDHLILLAQHVLRLRYFVLPQQGTHLFQPERTHFLAVVVLHGLALPLQSHGCN